MLLLLKKKKQQISLWLFEERNINEKDECLYIK